MLNTGNNTHKSEEYGHNLSHNTGQGNHEDTLDEVETYDVAQLKIYTHGKHISYGLSARFLEVCCILRKICRNTAILNLHP